MLPGKFGRETFSTECMVVDVVVAPRPVRQRHQDTDRRESGEHPEYEGLECATVKPNEIESHIAIRGVSRVEAQT
jgi:hypothetical protein